MNFLQWLDKEMHYSAMHIELSYNKIADWVLHIYKKGCALDGFQKNMSQNISMTFSDVLWTVLSAELKNYYLLEGAQ